MGTARRIAALCCVVSLVAGCFQAETTVLVKPDGSGTIEERMLISGKVAQQMGEMAKAFAGPEGETKPFTLHDREKLRKRAGELGEGVALVSSGEIREGGYTGYRALYSFRDISKVRLSREGGKSMAEPGAKSDAGGNKPILFRFTPGKTARLVVISPRNETQTEAAAKGAEQKASEDSAPKPTPEQEKEIAEMMKGMRFALVIEVAGHVLESNATHRDGNRVTLFDFDLDRLGGDPEKLRSLQRAESVSFVEARELLKDFPGLKVDMNDRLEILFTR
jgi:hypothetical protein